MTINQGSSSPLCGDLVNVGVKTRKDPNHLQSSFRAFQSQQRFVANAAHQLRMYELANNLVDNAIRYTQAGGRVTVSVANGNGVQLAVEDNGPGIPSRMRSDSSLTERL